LAVKVKIITIIRNQAKAGVPKKPLPLRLPAPACALHADRGGVKGEGAVLEFLNQDLSKINK